MDVFEDVVCLLGMVVLFSLLSFCENGGPAEGVKVNWELQIKGTIGTTLIGSCE